MLRTQTTGSVMKSGLLVVVVVVTVLKKKTHQLSRFGEMIEKPGNYRQS